MKKKSGDKAWALLEQYVGRAVVTSEAPDLQPGRRRRREGLPWAGVRRLALKIDFAIGTLAEAVGAALVLAETCILFAGVVSRYVFNSPLMWTDELANFLFLWLAMLGAVVAFRRDGHMRLTTFVNSLGPRMGPTGSAPSARSSSSSSCSKSWCRRAVSSRSSTRPS